MHNKNPPSNYEYFILDIVCSFQFRIKIRTPTDKINFRKATS